MSKSKNDIAWEQIFEQLLFRENKLSINLIEAKNYISDDFLIRQLYYPCRLWNDRITKQVRPVFLIYSNGIFYLRGTVKESELPFPQADSFERVINLCELLKQKGFLSKEGITQNYEFDHRQTDYYANAATYLGLIERTRENNLIMKKSKLYKINAEETYRRRVSTVISWIN
ncbi:MAG: hypothetical protein LBS04_07795 [Tannerellaceae bacterium]|jgi:hypothetical protein|nr:hypothetical protein [Tannerellaceae bacterium]